MGEEGVVDIGLVLQFGLAAGNGDDVDCCGIWDVVSGELDVRGDAIAMGKDEGEGGWMLEVRGDAMGKDE